MRKDSVAPQASNRATNCWSALVVEDVLIVLARL
jgi:hypothetical protein